MYKKFILADVQHNGGNKMVIQFSSAPNATEAFAYPSKISDDGMRKTTRHSCGMPECSLSGRETGSNLLLTARLEHEGGGVVATVGLDGSWICKGQIGRAHV